MEWISSGEQGFQMERLLFLKLGYTHRSLFSKYSPNTFCNTKAFGKVRVTQKHQAVLQSIFVRKIKMLLKIYEFVRAKGLRLECKMSARVPKTCGTWCAKHLFTSTAKTQHAFAIRASVRLNNDYMHRLLQKKRNAQRLSCKNSYILMSNCFYILSPGVFSSLYS